MVESVFGDIPEILDEAAMRSAERAELKGYMSKTIKVGKIKFFSLTNNKVVIYLATF